MGASFRFGEISSVKAIINKSTGDCKGYGFVDFASADDARKALEQLKTRKVQAQFAKVRNESMGHIINLTSSFSLAYS